LTASKTNGSRKTSKRICRSPLVWIVATTMSKLLDPLTDVGPVGLSILFGMINTRPNDAMGLKIHKVT
jgi:hypothetical protein